MPKKGRYEVRNVVIEGISEPGLCGPLLFLRSAYDGFDEHVLPSLYVDNSILYLHPSRTKKEGRQLIQRAVRIHTVASCYPLDSTRMSIWWWQKAITLPALLQALLFLTAGHHATLESNNGVSSLTIRKTINDSLHLRSNTLKTLNDLLQDPAKAVAESTTLIVASLVAIEVCIYSLSFYNYWTLFVANLFNYRPLMPTLRLSKPTRED